MTILWIIVLVTTLQQPKEHVGLRVHMPYDTRFTCEHAAEEVDGEAVSDTLAIPLKLYDESITIRKVVIECEQGTPQI